jgi:hypothetical protein
MENEAYISERNLKMGRVKRGERFDDESTSEDDQED